ncbi:uncharacterized protein LOC127705174 [Mytilus californianus]|uniref:uncharacterized protein LOC127705174 n=1 Tax=Mytilus californianus TaxID=6549 RepID=UPI0022467E4B|nr:uncharacterized protein LOC127705174 [Mytilus californianus]
MDETKRITRNLSFIKKTVTEIDSVIDILIEEDILGMGERNLILLDEDPIHSVLEIVLKKQAYKKFTKALQCTGNERIVARLEATDLRLEKESSMSSTDQDNMYTDNEYKQHKASMLQNDLDNLTKENYNLKQQQAQIRKDLNCNQHRLLELNREACKYQKENLELSQRLSNLRRGDLVNSVFNDLEEELKRKENRNTKLKKELDLKKDEVTHLRNQLDDLRKEVDEKTDQIAMLSREMRHLREEHISARTERRELKLKVENINKNFDEKMQNMMNVISENKVNRTPRQSTFTRISAHSRNQSKDRGQNRESSILPTLQGKTPGTPKSSNTHNSTRESPISPRARVTRPRQFISPQFVFTAKPQAQWK